MLQVTRTWIAAFAVAAMAVPIAVFSLVAAILKYELEHGEWLMLGIFSVLLLAFIALAAARRQFCALTTRMQLSALLVLIVLTIVGYWAIHLNIKVAV